MAGDPPGGGAHILYPQHGLREMKLVQSGALRSHARKPGRPAARRR